jgi:diketogulonate reductase-like aldo/keto reductase
VDGIVTIPGMTRASRAAESAGAMKFKLSGDELTRLDERPARAVG